MRRLLQLRGICQDWCFCELRRINTPAIASPVWHYLFHPAVGALFRSVAFTKRPFQQYAVSMWGWGAKKCLSSCLRGEGSHSNDCNMSGFRLYCITMAQNKPFGEACAEHSAWNITDKAISQQSDVTGQVIGWEEKQKAMIAYWVTTSRADMREPCHTEMEPRLDSGESFNLHLIGSGQRREKPSATRPLCSPEAELNCPVNDDTNNRKQPKCINKTQKRKNVCSEMCEE